ncbi:MAG: glycosyltransferase [Sulfitobacter sp.]|nr:glycosyltransferase [Sulfitobacter sp.]
MNIAYILNTYPQPSQSFIRREIRALEAQGHDVHRIAMRPPGMTLVDAQDRAEADKTEYVLAEGGAVLLGALWRRLRADAAGFGAALRAAIRMGAVSEVGRWRHLIYLAEAAYVAERAAALGVTHLHAHFGTNGAAVAMLVRLLGGPKYSFTVHGPEEFDAPRALSLGDKIHHAAFTVAISQFGRSQLCRWAHAADWARIEVVHCGIEPAKFNAPAPLRKGPRGLVAIGRFVEQKGQLALIDALARKESDITLTLIGDGEMREQIESRIAQYRLGDRVSLTGWVDEARIADELARAHGLIMPSFAEGLPMVVMEAMAAARPVIATYIAGTPELVQEGKTGWLVPAGDVNALADAMDSLAKAPLSRLTKMGETGRSRVLERHDVAQEAARLARLMG